MKSKIIFLDFDGVLNIIPEGYDKYGAIFHSHFVNNLKILIDNTNAKIVISSSCRFQSNDMKNNLQIMKDMWKERNLPGEIIDITPNCLNIFKKKEKSEYYNQFHLKRGIEIQEWLNKNINNIINYVILDDDEDILDSQRKHFVLTYNNIHHSDYVDMGYGLTKECTEQAIDILNNNSLYFIDLTYINNSYKQ